MGFQCIPDAQITLRAWYEALAHSEPHSIIVTLLRTLIDEAPEPGKLAEESAAHSERPLEENAPQQQLHDHFTTDKEIPGQQDLTALLQALISGLAVGSAYALVALGFSVTFTTTVSDACPASASQRRHSAGNGERETSSTPPSLVPLARNPFRISDAASRRASRERH